MGVPNDRSLTYISRAIDAVAQESIPPLSNTTALVPRHGLKERLLFIVRCISEPRSLYAASGRMPDEFMELQS
jgi:hypothetical protein